jgi:acyl-CoA synthetase (AMP-forming)/AMP-acid ligase II
MTLFDLLSSKLPARSEHPAVIDGDRVIDYATLERWSVAVAAWLDEVGVEPGDRVGIHLRKSAEEVVATLAAARLGAVFVNLSYAWTPAQVEYVDRACALQVVFTDRRKASALGTLDGLLVTVDESSREAEAAGRIAWESTLSERPLALPGPQADDLAALLYTSGSTGHPKGVMLTHRNVVDGARIVSGYLGNTPADRVLGLLPMSFDYGMNQLTTMLEVGGTLVVQGVPFPAEIVKTVNAREVTGLGLVPPSWVELVAYLDASGERMPSLRYVTNTGGKIPDSTLERMPEVLPGVSIFLMYGLTESFRSTYLPPDQFARKRGAIGYAIPGVRIFVVDPDRGLCGPGETGELLHSGKLISRGYWQDPQATDSRIRVCEHLREILGDEKVVYSGDLVRTDEDGCLWFEGRRDDMIKCSGYRLSPTEVEDVAYSSGLITAAVAFGVPDPRLGQSVHLAVEHEGVETIDLAELLDFCRRRMPSYMVPELHPWPGRMPRTVSGKLDRKAVVRSLRGESEPRAVGKEE